MILLAGIYIHIPFCKQACHYCDFHFRTSQELVNPMVKAILKEVALQENFLANQVISTIYFGGGTPSILTVPLISSMLSQIEKHYKINRSLEITLEANPDDLTKAYLTNLLDSGINRLSIGIQSFQESVLQWMNRAHSSEQALQCIESARVAGFENISIDLIYGIPLNEYDFESDLMAAVELKPEHISAYNLTIEPGTLLGYQLKKGLVTEVDEEEAAGSFLLAMNFLKARGFQHYEISNFCLPGKESRHNIGYWNGEPYLGIGPSAHSFDGRGRQYNISSNGGYIKSIRKGEIPFSREVLTPQQRTNEMIMLGLRTDKGVGLKIESNSFSWDLEEHHRDYLEELVNRKLAIVKKNTLLLTDKGKLLADKIAEDLFVRD